MILSILKEQTKTLHIPYDNPTRTVLGPAGFPQSPSTYITSTNLHHLYVQHVQTTIIYSS